MKEQKHRSIKENTIKENVVLALGASLVTGACIYVITSGLIKKAVLKAKNYIEDRRWHKNEQKPNEVKF